MEATGALQRGKVHAAQYLDKLQVERDRGITVKVCDVVCCCFYWEVGGYSNIAALA